ncbi:hypothetical protein QUB80_15125 [Chlorogloeopsis sp. ULAP01]|uniref:hypothetical protein n=1 Tax=Chlorogloeopsis sp. ULAP01 TaxID=3056483 RepID=UPI0025AABB76|nr:hypothetical protein [Chlorogloeopsis sp. ULAP01]MDM9382034.1 hypothetical protein [Chlorogloeopsis sp. ULAP01]
MLKNISRNPPQKSSLPVELIPDPWETPSLTVETKFIPDTWQIPTQNHPLVPPLGIPEARRLPPAFNSIKVLLQDELKLKVTGGKLKTQMEQALGLLCWMEH